MRSTSCNNTTTHGTARFRASDLIEQSLNGRTPTAYDEHEDGSRTVNQPETIAAREKQQQLKDRFRDWVWEDRQRAERLAEEYNFRFNNLRLSPRPFLRERHPSFAALRTGFS